MLFFQVGGVIHAWREMQIMNDASTVDEPELLTPNSSTGSTRAEWNRLNLDTALPFTNVFLVICLLAAVPLLFISLRSIAEDAVLACFGTGIKASVAQINEPMSYTFSVTRGITTSRSLPIPRRPYFRQT